MRTKETIINKEIEPFTCDPYEGTENWTEADHEAWVDRVLSKPKNFLNK